LAGNVVEKQQGRPALRAAERLDLPDLEREHHRPRLPLARIRARRLLAEREPQVVRLRTDAGVAALAIARQATVQRREQPGLERRAAFAELVRVAPRGEVLERQRRLAAGHLRERPLR